MSVNFNDPNTHAAGSDIILSATNTQNLRIRHESIRTKSPPIKKQKLSANDEKLLREIDIQNAHKE